MARSAPFDWSRDSWRYAARASTVVRSLWAVLVAAALAVYLAWGIVGRRSPNAPLGIVLAVSVLVLPALCAVAVRRAVRSPLGPIPPAGASRRTAPR